MRNEMLEISTHYQQYPHEKPSGTVVSRTKTDAGLSFRECLAAQEKRLPAEPTKNAEVLSAAVNVCMNLTLRQQVISSKPKLRPLVSAIGYAEH